VVRIAVIEVGRVMGEAVSFSPNWVSEGVPYMEDESG
jgi:hypothetical protein